MTTLTCPCGELFQPEIRGEEIAIACRACRIEGLPPVSVDRYSSVPGRGGSAVSATSVPLPVSGQSRRSGLGFGILDVLRSHRKEPK